MIRFFLPLVALLASVILPLRAADEAESAQMAALQKVADGLNYQQGEITLRGGLVKIHLPSEFRYLSPNDTDTVITKLWGNPPTSGHTLGMLVPTETGLASAQGWGIIITYEEDGYVKDDDAAKINYDDLLKQMKKGTAEASKEREKDGYGSIELVGWAQPPRYDAGAHKMYWAKELRFGGNDESTLNYNIRMLGRRGVLVLNAVASMQQLPQIEQATPTILGMVNFQEGHRYTDFNASTDKVATYGLAALVAGGLLAKGGFFKILLGILIAGKKFAIIAVVAVGAWIKKLFGRKTEQM